MSPILLRPVREQLEHDRVIRLLQAKYKRKFDVAINPGNEQGTPVMVGQSPWYPDLVLLSNERGRKVLGVIEVETAESVNKVEAMSQWATFGRLRGAFHLYVPTSMIDVARQLCVDLQVLVGELWAATDLLLGLRYDENVAQDLLRGVRGMRESSTYQAILREGEEAGEVRAARRIILALGTDRFGAPDAASAATLERLHDPDVFDRLAINVHQTSSWNELLAPVSGR